MRIEVLGAIKALRGEDPVELGGRKPRMLLAALALHRGRPASVDGLIDLVWGDAPPPSALQTLHVYVADLRRALEPGRAPRTPAGTIVTAAPGYALRLPDDAFDVAIFDAALAAAQSRLGEWTGAAGELPRPPALSAAELAETIAALDRALALWRGTPYLELDDAPAAVAERTRLAELRTVALEYRAVARLALGEHATLAAELEALTAEHPLRERLWMLRVLALAGSHRQADALEALRQVRRVLADELGLDPGVALRELEGAVLRQDPALTWPPAVRPGVPGSGGT
ncbi:transcriptional regulator, partial [Nonomuraea sp. NN258]|uniref:AfsR/SARP family transcriptional regulator n=1 Tax=Nonomuraea antri TaxID=2730852 RepID=UPI00156865F0